MKFNVHAGHAVAGKGATGAVGYLDESTENRRVKNAVIKMLKDLGHTVYDCTNDYGKGSTQLKGIVDKCNKHEVDLDISIHFNAGVNKKKTDDKTTGTEVLIFSSDSKAKSAATRITKQIEKLGFTNRGVKVNGNLYVLHRTNSPALLIECCFVDDPDDAELYNCEAMAKAIVEGILGIKVCTVKEEKSEKSEKIPFLVRVKDPKEGLTIRKVPGDLSKSNVAGYIKDNNKYTIVEMKGSWGKLKSGAGWINCSSKYVDIV